MDLTAGRSRRAGSPPSPARILGRKWKKTPAAPPRTRSTKVRAARLAGLCRAVRTHSLRRPGALPVLRDLAADPAPPRPAEEGGGHGIGRPRNDRGVGTNLGKLGGSGLAGARPGGRGWGNRRFVKRAPGMRRGCLPPQRSGCAVPTRGERRTGDAFLPVDKKKKKKKLKLYKEPVLIPDQMLVTASQHLNKDYLISSWNKKQTQNRRLSH